MRVGVEVAGTVTDGVSLRVGVLVVAVCVGVPETVVLVGVGVFVGVLVRVGVLVTVGVFVPVAVGV
jgi:hypothetical protein